MQSPVSSPHNAAAVRALQDLDGAVGDAGQLDDQLVLLSHRRRLALIPRPLAAQHLSIVTGRDDCYSAIAGLETVVSHSYCMAERQTPLSYGVRTLSSISIPVQELHEHDSIRRPRTLMVSRRDACASSSSASGACTCAAPSPMRTLPSAATSPEMKQHGRQGCCAPAF